MRFGHFIMGTRAGSYQDIVDQVVLADGLGFDTTWLAERHFEHSDLLWPAPLVAAAFLAAKTERIRIGLAARILPFHNPIDVAEEIATLDQLSGGRVEVGFTRGGLDPKFHDVYGVSPEISVSRFEESMDILERAWRGETFSYEGEHFRYRDVCVRPLPVQRPHPPITMVSNSPASMERSAARGLPLFLNGIQDNDDLVARHQSYVSLLRLFGHSPAARYVLNRFIYVGESMQAARDTMREPFMAFISNHAPDLKMALERRYGAKSQDFEFLAEHVAIFGDAEHCIEKIRALEQCVPFTELMGTFNYLTLEHSACVDSMQRFAREVMPALRSPKVTRLNASSLPNTRRHSHASPHATVHQLAASY